MNEQASTKILELIENVDVDDTNVADMLDEIDHRVVIFVKGVFDEETTNTMVQARIGRIKPKQYTRSRDALKNIRPEGWVFMIRQWKAGWMASMMYGDVDLTSKALPTEELAELHAIVQAKAYMRKENE